MSSILISIGVAVVSLLVYQSVRKRREPNSFDRIRLIFSLVLSLLIALM